MQVFHELFIDEEEEKVKEQGKQEDREVESGENQGEEIAHVDDMWMKFGPGSNLSQREYG